MRGIIMSRSIQLLDCTLRDGAYIVEGNFGTAAIKGIIKKLDEARVDIIECGWLKNSQHLEGSSYYRTPEDAALYIGNKKANSIYVAMIDWDRYDLSLLPDYDGKSIDAVRVVFPKAHFVEGIDVARQIREKGYKVYLQAANTLGYSDEELLQLVKGVNELKPESISIVDTFGAMFSEDIEHISLLLDRNLDKSIGLGFHSHNNQQLSFALSMKFIEVLRDSQRRIIVDSSLCGMGRGAGNTTTELMVNYLNRKHYGNYDMNAVMDAIDTYMGYFQSHYDWGYSTQTMISGMYCCHVNNIAYLRENHRVSARDMRNIIASLPDEKRLVYDYDLLEKKYLEHLSYIVDDKQNISDLKEALAGRSILLLAPGNSSIEKQPEINEFIKDNNPIVIGVNVIQNIYDYDYLFFVKKDRYEYGKVAHSKQFKSTKKIILSSVKTDAKDNEMLINFERIVSEKYYDNAMINAIQVMNLLEVDQVYVAGFDGFTKKKDENYSDSHLPTVNFIQDEDELNQQIKKMFNEICISLRGRMKISFLTESIFDTER